MPKTFKRMNAKKSKKRNSSLRGGGVIDYLKKTASNTFKDPSSLTVQMLNDIEKLPIYLVNNCNNNFYSVYQTCIANTEQMIEIVNNCSKAIKEYCKNKNINTVSTSVDLTKINTVGNLKQSIINLIKNITNIKIISNTTTTGKTQISQLIKKISDLSTVLTKYKDALTSYEKTIYNLFYINNKEQIIAADTTPVAQQTISNSNQVNKQPASPNLMGWVLG